MITDQISGVHQVPESEPSEQPDHQWTLEEIQSNQTQDENLVNFWKDQESQNTSDLYSTTCNNCWNVTNIFKDK